jgi:hypothetical protein
MRRCCVDFDAVADRADHCGTTWALRTIARLRREGVAPPAQWPGTLAEARRLVLTFAEGVGVLGRERLAQAIQRAAQVEYEAWRFPEGEETGRAAVLEHIKSQPFARLARVA